MADLVTLAHLIIQNLPADTVVGPSYSPLGAGIAFGVAAAGAGIGIGRLVASALDGAARQPEQANTLRGIMILGIAFIEALALIAIVMGLITVFIK